MRYYIYNYLKKDTNYTVIFDYYRTFEPEVIREDLRQFYNSKESSNKLIYIYPVTNTRENESEIIKNISDIAQIEDTYIKLIGYNKVGFVNDESIQEINDIISYGLLEIVKNRNAIMGSDDNFHYITPSQKHSPFFIRTGNIFLKNEEIYFIGLFLIQKIKNKKINRIACDTSSIMHLAFSINYIKSIFNDHLEIPIESFNSYTYKEEGYVFKPRTLVLISASSSGDLEDEILQSERDLELVTIILNSKDPGNRKYLININPFFDDLIKDYPNKKQYKNSEECEYCDQNSIAVLVRGEQFIPSKVLKQEVEINKGHKPIWLEKVIEIFCSNNAIYSFKGESLRLKKRDIYIEVDKLFDNSIEFNNDFNSYLKNHLPPKVDLIVYLPDKGSKLIASKVYDYYNSNLIHKVASPIESTKLNEVGDDIKNNEQVLLIVASCLTTGNKFNSLSRDLRTFKKSSIHYFSIFSRLQSERKYSILKSNLKHKTKGSIGINKFHEMYYGYFGDYHDNLTNKFNKPTWSNEIEFWKTQKDLPKTFADRYAMLTTSNGLNDNLFFDNPFNKERLVLRPNFAFYDKFKSTPSQADLYMIFSSIFHLVRYPEYQKEFPDKKLKFLRHHEHCKSIISPECFNRYNDGIIQAAILRIAFPNELNYSIDEQFSETMMKVIKDIFNDPKDLNKCEGILEFLYAIASNKMKFYEGHKAELLKHFSQKFSQNDEVNFLLKVAVSN